MTQTLRIALAQVNQAMGDLKGNADAMLAWRETARGEGADSDAQRTRTADSDRFIPVRPIGVRRCDRRSMLVRLSQQPFPVSGVIQRPDPPGGCAWQ